MLSIEVSLARPEGELLPAYNMLSYKVRRKCRGEGLLSAPAPRSAPPLRALRQLLAPYTSAPAPPTARAVDGAGRYLSVARHATRGLLLIVLRIGLSLLLVAVVGVVDDSETDEHIGDEDTREATIL